MTDETRAPVADVVGVISNGDPVFAVFREQDGDLQRQRFVVAQHDDGNRSIVLESVADSASGHRACVDGKTKRRKLGMTGRCGS